MVDTKNSSTAVDNWEGSISQIPQRYRQGVEDADNVVDKMIAAEDVWVEAIIEAANNKARQKGLEGLSDREWKNLTTNKGASRIGPGMRAAKAGFKEGIGKVISALQEVDLPARTTSPMQNIDNRVKPIVKRMVEVGETA